MLVFGGTHFEVHHIMFFCPSFHHFLVHSSKSRILLDAVKFVPDYDCFGFFMCHLSKVSQPFLAFCECKRLGKIIDDDCPYRVPIVKHADVSKILSCCSVPNLSHEFSSV